MSSYDVDRPQLKVGVLMENAQLSDMAFVDILDQLSLPHVQAVAAYGMAEFLPLAIDMQWHYIASSLEPAVLAPAVRFVPTHTYDSAPHDLDIIFVGGVPVSFRPAAATVFLQKAVPRAKAVFTTCLGSLWLASAGLLKDRNATTNRLALTASRDMFPETKWQEQRWVVDGNIWSAGGPGAAIDMMATYVMANYDKKFARISCWNGLDFDPRYRGQFYVEPEGKAIQDL